MPPSLDAIRRDTIFKTLSGSHAYGLAIARSDRDVRGICLLRDRRHYFGLSEHRFEQQERWEQPGDDTVIFEFRKAMRLMAVGSPAAVEMVFAPDAHRLEVGAAFRPVLAERQRLVTQRLGRNYLHWGRQMLDDMRRQRLKLSDPAIIDALLGRLGASRQASFNRELGYDTKLAMHMVRTLRMAEEVLTEGLVRVARPDAEELLRIRAGAWSFAEVTAFAEAAAARGAALVEASTLPEEVDMAFWEDLTVEIVAGALWPPAAATRA